MREHITYANVVATIALFGVVAGGGAYAAGVIDSGDIVDNSVKSRDLKDRNVRGKDIRRNVVTRSEVKESSLKASQFLPAAWAEGSCDPAGTSMVECAEARLRLPSGSQLFIVASGEFVSEGNGARLTCSLFVDGNNTGASVAVGETMPNTDTGAADGFGLTHVTGEPRSRGQHDVSLRCQQPTAGDGRLAGASIAVLGITE